MTKKEFELLEPGTKVWLKYPHFNFPWLGIIRRKEGHNCVYVNFFGDAQATFYYANINDHVTLFEEKP